MDISDAQINGWWVTLGKNFGEQGVDQCKPNFDTIWERLGLTNAIELC